MDPEWLPPLGNTIGLVGVLAWLVWAVVTGHLLSGSEARRNADVMQAMIDRQSKIIDNLLKLGGLTTALTEALPKNLPPDTVEEE